ncbi:MULTISPECIES: hypothetical protein [Staphylococcus]|nr:MULTISPECIES: hypothetical protein [Staphylococcus]MDS3954817.1 hypothetical protein [Staphylococcus epidermidis]
MSKKVGVSTTTVYRTLK